jgi:hypothetical protein
LDGERAKAWEYGVDPKFFGYFLPTGIVIADLFSLLRIGIPEENVIARTG